MPHSSLQSGMQMGMRAAEMYQRGQSAEKDRDLRKLMAKEQQEATSKRAREQQVFSLGMAEEQQDAMAKAAKLVAEARKLDAKAERDAEKGLWDRSNDAKVAAAKLVAEAKQITDEATATSRAKTQKMLQTQMDADIAYRKTTGTTAATNATAQAAYRASMSALAQSAEQRAQEKDDRDSRSPRVVYEQEMDDMNTDMDAIDDQLEAFTLTGGPRNPQEARTFKRLTEKRQRIVMAMKIRSDAYAKTGAGAPTGSRIVVEKPDLRTHPDNPDVLLNPGGFTTETRTTTPIYGNQPLNPGVRPGTTQRGPQPNPVSIPGNGGSNPAHPGSSQGGGVGGMGLSLPPTVPQPTTVPEAEESAMIRAMRQHWRNLAGD